MQGTGTRHLNEADNILNLTDEHPVLRRYILDTIVSLNDAQDDLEDIEVEYEQAVTAGATYREAVRLFRMLLASRGHLYMALDRYNALAHTTTPALRVMDTTGNESWDPITSADELEIIRVLIPVVQEREN